MVGPLSVEQALQGALPRSCRGFALLCQLFKVADASPATHAAPPQPARLTQGVCAVYGCWASRTSCPKEIQFRSFLCRAAEASEAPPAERAQAVLCQVFSFFSGLASLSRARRGVCEAAVARAGPVELGRAAGHLQRYCTEVLLHLCRFFVKPQRLSQVVCR